MFAYQALKTSLVTISNITREQRYDKCKKCISEKVKSIDCEK